MKRETAQTLPIIIALITAIAPHTPGLPLWINLWCILLWGYMLIRLKTGWPLPSAPLRYFLTFISLAGFLATYRAGIGGDAFVGLMALMAAVKPFEMPTHRHRMITILLTYFIIITSLFRSESLFILVYMLWSVFVTTTALVRINTPGGSIRSSARLALSIQAGALPLVLVLFLVFPRLPGSLLGVEDQTSGRTGFSDRLSPGSVTRLIQDPTPAFRVEFEGEIPRAGQLYWRGIVFTAFDGRTWRHIPDWTVLRNAEADPGEQSIAYTVLLAPNFSRQLMALDRPLQGPSWSRITGDGSMISLKRIVQKTAYQAVSRLPDQKGAWPTQKGFKPGKAPFIRLSGDIPNPRARQLAGELAKTAATPEEKAMALISHFSQAGFTYSTTPPPLSGPPLDTFLLETKTGYCEHYASAFAFMMNVLGVPARVVGGYLGGELNPFGNYLIVRQAYAHAWAEYFDPASGWVRIDPTLAVAPDRITVHPDGSAARSGKASFSFLRRALFMLDALNLKWETWFTGYSLAEQQALLETLGISGKGQTPWVMLSLLSLLSLVLFLTLLVYVMKRKKSPRDPVAAAYALFLKKNGPGRSGTRAGTGTPGIYPGLHGQAPGDGRFPPRPYGFICGSQV